MTLTERLQQKCSDWGAYWRASDAHGVVLTHEQALELLRDALGVEAELKDERGAADSIDPAQPFTEPDQRRWSLILKDMAEVTEDVVRAFAAPGIDGYNDALLAFDNRLAAHLDRVSGSAAEPGALASGQPPGSREAAMVVIERDDSGKPTVWCDPEISDLITALNKGGMPTVASCSGHGEKPGWIALKDGRQLVLAPNLDAAKALITAGVGVDRGETFSQSTTDDGKDSK